MTSSLPFPIDFNTQQLCLEIASTPPTIPTVSTPGAKRRAYLNQICLDACLNWLRETGRRDRQVWPSSAALPSFWELCNGSAIVTAGRRWVILPTEAIDAEELRVPQEWVDIPTWAADYYLLIQVNTDEDWMRVIGHSTHHDLKTLGQYDANDRSYCLDVEQLTTDINLIDLTQEFCPSFSLQSPLDSLPPLPQAQAENLLTRLGNRDLIFPRLEIPFSLWGSLLEHGGWRQRLYELRQGYAEQWSIQRWLQSGLSQFADQFGWTQTELQPIAIPGMRSANSEQTTPALARNLTIADQDYVLQILPQGNEGDLVWRFSLISSTPDRLIPAGFTLRLLTEDLQSFENNTDTATQPVQSLFVDVILETGEGIVWEIEPMPNGYDREILRF